MRNVPVSVEPLPSFSRGVIYLSRIYGKTNPAVHVELAPADTCLELGYHLGKLFASTGKLLPVLFSRRFNVLEHDFLGGNEVVGNICYLRGNLRRNVRDPVGISMQQVGLVHHLAAPGEACDSKHANRSWNR